MTVRVAMEISNGRLMEDLGTPNLPQQICPMVVEQLMLFPILELNIMVQTITKLLQLLSNVMVLKAQMSMVIRSSMSLLIFLVDMLDTGRF